MSQSLHHRQSAALSTRAHLITPSGTSQARTAGRVAVSAGRDLVDFTIGEFAIDVDPIIKGAAIRAIAENRNGYSDTIGLSPLRAAIAGEVSRSAGHSWTADEVAVTAGAKSALLFLALALLDSGDEVIVPTPYWQTFPAQIRIAGGQPIFVNHRADGQLDVEAIERAITPRTRVLLINTPNNPTGAVYSAEVLGNAAELAQRHNLWIIFDQCYRSFVHSGNEHHNIVALVPAIRERTIIIDSFSKTLAIAGWRIGYVVAPKSVIAAIRSFQSHMTSCANVIGQYGVLPYLQSRQDRFQSHAMGRLTANRSVGLDILARLRNVPTPLAQGGFYFYLDVSTLLRRSTLVGTSQELVDYLIETAGAATVSGVPFGDPSGLRISYALKTDDLVAGLTRVVDALNALI